ncbi:SRPBCC family protein [Alteribacillus sp. JSM 102045]|uniref:SRPBCC family protein n=1 Tax=Alteribacillus sp. JSM 102045 TaxID=1562101 RepID=UPI0035C25AA1
MKKWTKTIEIDVPIEEVWELLDGSLENMQKIMPNVVENEPVKITEEGVGSIYLQKYKEGKRIEEYEVEMIEYLNTPEQKILKVGFVLANMFDITAKYELTKLDSCRTQLIYTATNRPLKWFVKIFLMFATKKAGHHVCSTSETCDRNESCPRTITVNGEWGES